MMNTVIYRASKKSDTYLYVVHKDDFSQLPEILLTSLGKLHFVMQLELEQETKLAQADVTRVILALQHDGFYLQLPDDSEKLQLAGKTPVSNPIPSL